MRKLAMVLAVAFTMGLAASTVSASTKDATKKTDKKECCAKAKECTKDKKACCASADKKADTPAPTK
ncbi:MAG: hypothetical protein Q8N05_01975 [Bacteroidota bacterium]|nr:hypothetical protein [Bacteroidota bacterium]